VRIDELQRPVPVTPEPARQVCGLKVFFRGSGPPGPFLTPNEVKEWYCRALS